jgi:transcriptional antiterminator RfaH
MRSDGLLNIEKITMNWYVVYTKPKWEKKVAERLNEIGIVAYCPQITKLSQWSDRKKLISVPLFNSYIFVQIEEKNRNQIFAVTGVVRYLFWLGKAAVVKDSEIETIKNWLSAPNVYEVSVDQWKKGDTIVLESGPFISQSAVIQEVKQNHYILILESLGCVLKVNKKEL